MVGKTVGEFIDELYYCPEIEFRYGEIRYMLSGFPCENGDYYLQLNTIEKKSKVVFFHKSSSRQECVNCFEQSPIFDGKTIYEAERDIEVLFG